MNGYDWPKIDLIVRSSLSAGPRIGTLSNRPIHDFIESDGARWIFDGKNFAGRVLATSDIVHHQAVYSQVTR